MIALALAAMISGQAAPTDVGRVQLLRSLHVIAYLSPNICTGADQIAIQTFNVGGTDRSMSPAVDFGEVEITVYGKRRAGNDVTPDQTITIDGSMASGEDAIRCVSSAARRAGATLFTVGIGEATYRLATR